MPNPDRPGPSNSEFDRFRQVVECSLDMVVIFDAAGLVVYTNLAFTRVSGYTPEDAIGKPARELGTMPAELEADLGETLRRGEQWCGEWETAKKNGELYWVSTTITPLRDATGRITHLAAMTRDVTVRHLLEDELKRREEYFRSLVEGAADVVAVVDLRGTVNYISPSATAVSGWRPEELVGRNMIEFVHPEDREFVLRRFREAIGGAQREGSTQYRSIAKDGSYNTIDVTGRLLPDGSGYVINSRDITERARMEDELRASEQRFRVLAQLSPMAILLVDGLSIVYANPAAEEITGYTTDELLSMKFWDAVSPDRQDGVRKTGLARQRGEDVPSRYEVRFRRRGGEERWADIAAARVPWGDRTVTLATAMDTTERKQAEEALRESEERLRSTLNAAPVMIWTTDANGITTLSEGLALADIGYRPGELVGTSFVERNKGRPETVEAYRRALGGETVSRRAEVAGHVFHVVYSPARDAAGNVSGVIGVATDITLQARAEDALRASEQRFRTMAEATAACIYILDGSQIIYANPEAERVTGYSMAELCSMEFWDIAHPDFRDMVREGDAARRRGEVPSSRYEVQVLRKDGKTRWMEAAATIVDYDGRRVTLGTAIDITERKLADEALRASEERFRQFAENLEDIVWITDAGRNKVLYVNDAYEAMYGRPRQEILENRASFLEAIHPDDRGIGESMLKRPSQEKFESEEYRVIRPDGSIRWLRNRSFGILDTDGAVVRVAGIVEDMTERRLAEDAVRESEARYRALYQDNPAMYFTVDEEGTILSVNEFGAAQLGYRVDELVGRPVTDLVFESDRKTVGRRLSHCLRHPDTIERHEFRKVRKGGMVIWVREMARAVTSPGGERTVLLVCEDITALKEMEASLQKAREELERKAERQIKRRNPYRLTFRELTVLHLVVAGKSDKEIAATLGISPLTAHKHVSRILQRMQAESRTEASVRAIRDGLVT